MIENRISYIISSHERTIQLAGCLCSLTVQSEPRELIVCDNSTTPKTMAMNKEVAEAFEARYIYTGNLTCYHPLSVTEPKGNWLCFPSDDSYYVPGFSTILLSAACRHLWQFIYCDMLYDPRFAFATNGLEQTYAVMEVEPRPGKIDKTCFVIATGVFEEIGGWPEHPQDWRDGALAEAVVGAGYRHGKAGGAMVVHN